MRQLNRRRSMGGAPGRPYDAEIEYLETSTHNASIGAYINTGIKFRSGYSIVIKLTNLANTTGNFAYFGVCNGSNAREGEVALFSYDDKYQVVYPTTSNNVGSFDDLTPFTRNEVVTIEINQSTTTLSSNSIGTKSISTKMYPQYESSRDIYLFCTNRGWSVYFNLFRLHSFLLKDENGEPILDLFPVRVGNEGFMYDRVSGRLYGNSGSGKFILGPDI